MAGHRFVTLPGSERTESLHGDLELPLWTLATEQLEAAAPKHIVAAGALGFDMVVTEAARALGIPYVLALPYKGFEMRWKDGPRQRLLSLIMDAARIHYVSSAGYSELKMRKRNQWMVDNSDWTLALWSGRKGSTANTIMYAWSRRKQVKNIWPEFVKQAV
ncbi:SLOG family protein [Mesorhizobium sp.]|uniref:SLOG family protein n=1 Tax=Mesorhizobium sp. TaxID=1871066 RepID=UPI000FE9E726|nr:SLOG family protein [Mesorhizobium sp.]RWI35482.1 MAG: DUF1273 family protein [Mesorhizobium sp.]RWJ66349.1 MAG: DUF1273 family protein [Mesorhizobium sp.]